MNNYSPLLYYCYSLLYIVITLLIMSSEKLGDSFLTVSAQQQLKATPTILL